MPLQQRQHFNFCSFFIFPGRWCWRRSRRGWRYRRRLGQEANQTSGRTSHQNEGPSRSTHADGPRSRRHSGLDRQWQRHLQQCRQQKSRRVDKERRLREKLRRSCRKVFDQRTGDDGGKVFNRSKRFRIHKHQWQRINDDDDTDKSDVQTVVVIPVNLSRAATRVFNGRLKTQQHAVNACWRRVWQRAFKVLVTLADVSIKFFDTCTNWQYSSKLDPFQKILFTKRFPLY